MLAERILPRRLAAASLAIPHRFLAVRELLRAPGHGSTASGPQAPRQHRRKLSVRRLTARLSERRQRPLDGLRFCALLPLDDALKIVPRRRRQQPVLLRVAG